MSLNNFGINDYPNGSLRGNIEQKETLKEALDFVWVRQDEYDSPTNFFAVFEYKGHTFEIRQLSEDIRFED